MLLWAIEYLLPLTVGRLGFSRMSPAARRRLIETRITGPHALLRQLSKLRVLFAAGYYDDPGVHADIGVARSRRDRAARPAAAAVSGRPRRARRRSTPTCA